MNLHKAVDRMPRTVIVLGAAILSMVLVALLVGTVGAQDSATRTGSQKDSTGTAEDAMPSLSVASSGLATQDLAGGLTPSDLANKLVGSGVTVSNATYTGANTAGGTFSGGTEILDFEDGVILSSGNVATVVGPNQFDSVTTSHGGPGDADLDALVNGGTQDAAVLEFDFVPDADKIFFSYVFASDEYNEYVNSGFDDVFAFLINGQNCATVDGDRVSINTINNGNPDGLYPPDATRPELYINNDLSNGGGSINTEMDGLTKTLTCEAPVTPNQTNHIKLAIADRNDTAYDSNVFLEAGSFSTCGGAYDAHFRPPLDEGVYNAVQKGRVIPVKISIGCNGQNLTDLSPAIQLLKGDKSDGTETSSDAIETFSSSAADTTGIMRAVDDGYIYNLQVPNDAVAGDLYTIRVRPFGDSNTSASMYVVLQIRK
jgi:hypothetical protein